jgi:translation initiation factor 2B subunit (eIF-2B alpha/beta/delta family)
MSSRWDDWIKLDIYKKDLENVEEYSRNKSGSFNKSNPFYTKHGPEHCKAVENKVKELIEKSEIKLSDLEKFILICSVWTHDLGMNDDISKAFFIDMKTTMKNVDDSYEKKRDMHDEIAAWYLKKEGNIKNIFKLDDTDPEYISKLQKYQSYVDAINLISKYHRMKTDISECDKELGGVDEQRIKSALLASLLRFGDTLHVDSSRFDLNTYEILQLGQMDRSSRLHWLKSYVVRNIVPNPSTQSIDVNIRLPHSILTSYKNNKDLLKENIKYLEDVVTSDIIKDMHNVKPIFDYYKLPFYSKVTPHTTYIQGYDRQRSTEIEGIISDLAIAFSPNTSKVIDMTIDNVNIICNSNYENGNEFVYEMEQLIKNLKKFLKQKSSHVGLSKIIKVIESDFNNTIKKEMRGNPEQEIPDNLVTKCQETILKSIDNISTERKNARDKINDNNKILHGIKNIILFAYSEMVLNYIDEFEKHERGWKDRVNIYVLECSGKRRFTTNNEIEYNDGLQYSRQLSRRNFKKIYLLPDTSFGSLLRIMEKNRAIDKSIVLFGVNGINEKNGNCIHDSGHLMISIVANAFKVPVYVISDTFKEGELNWNADAMNREWGTYWLTAKTSLLKKLESNNIKLINYKEDEIPREYIKSIISEKGEIWGTEGEQQKPNDFK